MRFWPEKCPFTDDPRYAVEFYGHTRIFTKLEYLQEFRDKLSGTRWDTLNQIVVQPVMNYLRGRTRVIGKYRALRYGSERAYIIVRHHKEIAQFLDFAIAHFSSPPADPVAEARTK